MSTSNHKVAKKKSWHLFHSPIFTSDKEKVSEPIGEHEQQLQHKRRTVPGGKSDGRKQARGQLGAGSVAVAESTIRE